MTTFRWTRALLALVLGAAGNWQPAWAAEFRCWNGDLVRRIELSGPDTAQGVACEVRYWRNAEAPDNGRSLWRANRDFEFCAARARELIARLEAGGWTCSSGEPSSSAGPEHAAGVDPDSTAGLESPPADVPARVARGSDPESRHPTAPAKPSSPAVARIAPAAAKERSEAVRPRRTDEHDSAVLAAHPNAAILDQVVEQTLLSVQELYGGQFRADLAAFGDLDGDGLEDAAVLITYQADRNEYVQYLVAYLFNGETFQSVATRNVGGRFLEALRADLQGIADGRILVELEALDGGETCCATRRTAFALERGQLVEVDDPGAASLERTDHIERPSPG